jgi:enolase-phosphatase E1
MIRTLLTDIEGTTSSISFVKEVLFPYAREKLRDFIRKNGEASDVRELIEEAKRLAGGDPDDGQICDQMIRWIDEDQKIPPLKALQGMIWREGYEKREFYGHIYEDAFRNLKRWHGAGIRLYIYSSGSVPAQHLLFGHTEYGDLTPLFSGYFDTRIGQKRESSSYTAIAQQIGPPHSILFLSDVREELDAARAAGLRTTQIVRPGTEPAGTHRMALSFDGIEL